MTRIHAGAVLDRAPGPKYLASLRFVEVASTGPLPRPSKLAKWRAEAPDDVTWSLVVPGPARKSARGPLRFDEEMEAAFEWTVEAAEALTAAFVVLPTAGEVTTGQRDRDLLSAWFERWPKEPRRTLVWHPAGLWDRELALPFARRLGVLWAFDPLESAPPPDGTLYARLKAIGLRKSFGETLLLDVLETLTGSSAEEAYVAIDSPRSFREASRLAQLAEASAP